MPPLESVGAATRVVSRQVESLSEVERESLLAFLRAWRQHWRASFEAHAGHDGEALIAVLVKRELDANRYLKLKRIAVEHLAREL